MPKLLNSKFKQGKRDYLQLLLEAEDNSYTNSVKNIDRNMHFDKKLNIKVNS